jgi:WhiB family redox-sensing transcriptional regulator
LPKISKILTIIMSEIDAQTDVQDLESISNIDAPILVSIETLMTIGRCANTDRNVFYPKDGHGFKIAEKICKQCVVREECLEYALTNRIMHGVWGGESERARKRILKQRSKGSSS